MLATLQRVTSADIVPPQTAGERAAVNNAAACVFNTAFTGTGALFCPVVYNGTAWVGG